MYDIVKGSRVRVKFQKAYLPCLAGAQMKVGLQIEDFTGVVRHFRGDDPVNPTVVEIFVDPETPCYQDRVQPYGCTCPGGHVRVDPKDIVEILGANVPGEV